jgi:hypothetical protein
MFINAVMAMLQRHMRPPDAHVSRTFDATFAQIFRTAG